MPIIYRHNIPSTSALTTRISPQPDPAPTVANADDSIVLSDLVRTGEASRLRRRGALRSAGAQALPQDQNDGPAQIVVSPTWDPEPEPEPEASPVFARNLERERSLRYGYASWGSARDRADVGEDGEEAGYTLFCGGDVEDVGGGGGGCTPYEPSALPWHTPQASSSTHRSPKKTRRTNGCGALLHMQASPRRRLGVWTAKSEASSGAVIALDAVYFDRAAVAKIVRSACGCIREGVGCAVCGNPLGTRYKPCKTAAEGIFSPRSRARAPHAFRPEGPQYWHAQSTPRARPGPAAAAHLHGQHSPSHNPTPSASPFFVYTFFASNVTPTPAFVFPPRLASLSQIQTQSQPQIQVQSQPQAQVQAPVRYQYQPQPRQFQYQAPAYLPVYVPSSTPPLPMATPPPRARTPASPADSGTPTAVSSPGPAFVPEADGAVFDRVLTASPMPLSDVEEREEDAYRYPYRGMGSGAVRFDADGEFVPEPSSPDKTGEVLMLPER